MDSQNTTSSSRVEDDTSSTRPDGQSTNDGHNEESAPSLARPQAHPRGAKLKPYNKTTSTIVGLYLAAFLCSIAHYVLFDQLHGSIASGEHASIPQSYATFISLLLITLFKASLLGCVGLCSTQYLWRVLRGQPIALSTIENLFQMRHNPVSLFYRHTILSLSFVLAAYTWIVPLATIYPSGALTISSTPFVLTQSTRMSVPELVFDPNFDPMLPEKVSRLAEFAGIQHEIPDFGNDHAAPAMVHVKTNLQVMYPRGFLLRFLKSVIAAGEIALEPPPALGENSTYMLEVMGPQLSCRTVELSNYTTSNYNFVDLGVNEVGSHAPQSLTAQSTNSTDTKYEWQISQQTILGGVCRGGTDGLSLLETSKINCVDRYVMYVANVTFAKGIGSIHYTTYDIEPQPAKDLAILMQWEVARNQVPTGLNWTQQRQKSEVLQAAFTASPYFHRYREYLQEKFRWWNAYAVYYGFMVTIESHTNRSCPSVDDTQECDVKWTAPNGSQAEFGPVFCFKSDPTKSSMLEDSKLNPSRYLTSGEQDDTNRTTNVNVTVAGLNELLTNITFSLTTLNLWADDVNVTTTSYRNTYDFSHKLNLVLPYALCLAFGLPIVVMGIWSLQSNGVPATDGFMQVMMATRRRTEMERLVLEQGMVDTDEVSEELRNLKVRYGELVVEDQGKEERAFGFGTAMETVGLGKRKR